MANRMSHAALALLGLALFAVPASAEATLHACQDVTVLLPREWIALETAEGTLFRPIDDARFGGGDARVVICAAEKVAGLDAMGAMAWAYERATLRHTVVTEGDILGQLSAGGHPYLYQELVVEDPLRDTSSYLGFLVCQPREGVPMVITFGAPEVESFLWAAFLAGIFLESAHTDLAALDLTGFDLPASLNLPAAASE